MNPPHYLLLTIPIAVLLANTAEAEPRELIRSTRIESNLVEIVWNLGGLREHSTAEQRFLVEEVTLPDASRVELELESFAVTSTSTQFLLGRNGPDEPFAFNPVHIQIFRGQIRDRPGSDVFLAFGDFQSTGYIYLGPGDARYLISSKDKDGASLPLGVTNLFEARASDSTNSPAPQPGVPLCGTSTSDRTSIPREGGTAGGTAPSIRHLELAIDTDQAYFDLFQDRNAAAEYMVQLIAQVGHLFLRDNLLNIELVLVRLWDDPLPGVSPTSVSESVTQLGTTVSYDFLQFVSGSRFAGFGGHAFGVGCGATSEVFFIQGRFPDPSAPSPYHYDIDVIAHELGHNAGAPHTHGVGIDRCYDPFAPPQRGTIMSYCSQTYSGLNANQDFYFHRSISERIISLTQGLSCMPPDCNLNHRDDGLDISTGDSLDVNTNGVPDECEDCNDNGVLDNQDIASGFSMDVDLNGVPDDCQPDCNGNQIPDSRDIAIGDSSDDYGNSIPDECESDCNFNGRADYGEIQDNMGADIDRNGVLDECQACPEWLLRNSDWNVWIASGVAPSPIRQFYGSAGVMFQESRGQQAAGGQDVIMIPSGLILVTSAAEDRILSFDCSGTFAGDFVMPGSLGMAYPTSMLALSDGRLLVASSGTHNILAFDLSTGQPIGEFIASGSGGLHEPYGMTLGPATGIGDGLSLFVTSNLQQAGLPGEILEFDVDDGTFVGALVSSTNNGGLSGARDAVFKPDGNLLVTSFLTDEILEFDQSGVPLGTWQVLGFAVGGMTPESPWEIEIGPNGNVFVSRAIALAELEEALDGPALHLSNAQIIEYDIANGNFVRVYVGGQDHPLRFPTGFAFVQCEGDLDGDGVPDTCDTDIDSDGVANVNDLCVFTPVGSPAQANGTPIGDANIDCNVDLADLPRLLHCLMLSGPDGSPGACADFFDFDRDADVDLRDYAGFQRIFNTSHP